MYNVTNFLVTVILVVMAVSTFTMPYPFSIVGFLFLAGAAYNITNFKTVNKILTK